MVLVKNLSSNIKKSNLECFPSKVYLPYLSKYVWYGVPAILSSGHSERKLFNKSCYVFKMTIFKCIEIDNFEKKHNYYEPRTDIFLFIIERFWGLYSCSLCTLQIWLPQSWSWGSSGSLVFILIIKFSNRIFFRSIIAIFKWLCFRTFTSIYICDRGLWSYQYIPMRVAPMSLWGPELSI